MCFPNYKKIKLGLLVCILYPDSQFKHREDYFSHTNQFTDAGSICSCHGLHGLLIFKCSVSWADSSVSVLPYVTLALLQAGNRSLRPRSQNCLSDFTVYLARVKRLNFKKYLSVNWIFHFRCEHR